MKDQKKYNLKAIEQLAITISLILILIFGNSLGTMGISSADETNPADEKITPISGTTAEVNTITSADCQTNLAKFADPEFEKYTQYMEDNFKNKSTTSSLMDLAIQRYDKFKADIRAELELLEGRQVRFAASSEASDASQLEGLNGCEAAAREYISNAGKMLQMRAFTTSGIKKASIFVEKYQQINVKLRGMEQDVMKIVVNLSQFQQKLPCYLKTCA